MPRVKAEFCLIIISVDDKKRIFGGNALEFDFWDSFDYRQLTINCRQKDDADYSLMLNRARIGMQTKEDIELYFKHVIKKNKDLDSIANAVEFFCEKTKEFPKLLAMFSTSD